MDQGKERICPERSASEPSTASMRRPEHSDAQPPASGQDCGAQNTPSPHVRRRHFCSGSSTGDGTRTPSTAPLASSGLGTSRCSCVPQIQRSARHRFDLSGQEHGATRSHMRQAALSSSSCGGLFSAEVAVSSARGHPCTPPLGSGDLPLALLLVALPRDPVPRVGNLRGECLFPPGFG